MSTENLKLLLTLIFSAIRLYIFWKRCVSQKNINVAKKTKFVQISIVLTFIIDIN